MKWTEESIRLMEIAAGRSSYYDALADRICTIAKPKELIFCPHEPVTVSHVGPGMLAVFFFGKGR